MRIENGTQTGYGDKKTGGEGYKSGSVGTRDVAGEWRGKREKRGKSKREDFTRWTRHLSATSLRASS